jgi:DNA polymerase elongation subunit (family B)
MLTPIYAKVINNGSNIEIWSNKEKKILPLPFKPYFYTKEPKEIPMANEERDTVKFISDLQEHQVYKYSFQSVKEIPIFRTEESMEADIPYIQRVCIDEPSFFKDYPHEGNPDVLCFDIEVESEGKFPKSDKNPIIAIGCTFNDEPPEIFMINDIKEGDSHILESFMNYVDQKDPDVLCGYFSNGFDIPYIIDRCIKNDIPTRALTRDMKAEECFFLDDEGNRIMFIKGRANFDIFDEVARDQTLFGVSTRKMKDIAKWYNIDKTIQKLPQFKDYNIIVEDVSNTKKLIGTKQLFNYILSDILITRELSKIYLPNITTLCNIIGMPLNTMVQRTPSLLGTIFYARHLKEMNIISDSPNYKRYPDIFGTPTEVIIKGVRKNEFRGGSGFQGAIVEINPNYQRKLIKPIKKVDFSSLYPTIIYNFNISPETVSLHGYKDFIDKTFTYTDYPSHYLIEFSDNRIRKNIILKVEKKEGFLPKMMKEFLDQRNIIKQQLKKETDDDKKIELNSSSWCYKVLANATGFGINGSGFFRYSNVYVALLITAVGRFLIEHIKEKLNGKHIEIDTDGIYVEGDIDAKKLTEDLNTYIKETTKRITNFNMEQDEYSAGYFMKMKNYLLIDAKGKMVKHGVSFKASSKNLIFSHALDSIAKDFLLSSPNLKSTILKSYNFIDTAELKYFIQQSKINMAIEEYASQPSAGKKGCLQVQIGKQSKKFHEAPIQIGDSIAYVKTHSGYTIRENMKNTKMIDRKYYRKQIISVLERLNLKDMIWEVGNQGQMKLGEF